MLILHFTDEIDFSERKKRIFIRKKYQKHNEIKRFSINVKGKNVIVLELDKKNLKNEDVLTILKVYSEKVLVSDKYKDIEILKDLLFNPEEYYQRALLSSFINQIKTVNREWKNVQIKTACFRPFRELYEIVRLSKTVTILSQANVYTEKFINDCYYEYGVIVKISDNKIAENDVYMDLNKTDNRGRLLINVKGKEFLLYPDSSFFDDLSEYEILSQYNIEHNLICAAFSGK